MYTPLAIPDAVMQNLQTILICAGALIGLIAFLIGFFKGFTRIKWGGFIWGVIAACWLVFELKFHDKNPALSAFPKLAPEVRDFAGALTSLVAMVLAGMILFGLLGLIVRPKKKKEEAGARYYIINEARDPRDFDEDDLEDYEVEEDEFEKVAKKPDYLPRSKSPGAFNRILGGLVNILNVAIVIAVLAAVALVVIPMTPLAGKMDGLYSNVFVRDISKYVLAYAFDVVFLGIILSMAYSGYRSGFFGGLRSLIRAFSFLISVAVAVWFAMGKVGFAVKSNEFFAQLLGNKLPASVAKFAPVLGKICSGIVAFIVAMIAVAIIGAILKAISRSARKNSGIRFLDGAIGALVTLAIGVAVCFAICLVAYLPAYFGSAKFAYDGLFSENSVLTDGFFQVIEPYIKPLLDKLMAKFALKTVVL